MSFCQDLYPSSAEASLMRLPDDTLLGMLDILESVYHDEDVYIWVLNELGYRGLL